MVSNTQNLWMLALVEASARVSLVTQSHEENVKNIPVYKKKMDFIRRCPLKIKHLKPEAFQ